MVRERHPAPLVVDEVQYAPKWSCGTWGSRGRCARRPWGIPVTGSQPFEVMAGVTESLAGRAGVLQLSTLSFAEVLRAAAETAMRTWWSAAASRNSTRSRNWTPAGSTNPTWRPTSNGTCAPTASGESSGFRAIPPRCGARTAGLLNRAELARDVGISPTTAGQWLSVLERSGVVTLLEPWFSNRTKSLVKTPKLHFRDTGLCAFLMGIVSRGDLMDSPIAGSLWESMVCGELQRLIETGAPPWQLAFWRDRTKEADFLLHRAGHFRLADAKWSEHPEGPGKLALVRQELRPRLPPCAIVCRSANRYPIAAGVEASPWPISRLPPGSIPVSCSRTGRYDRSASQRQTCGQRSRWALLPIARPMWPAESLIAWRSVEPTRSLKGSLCAGGTRSSLSAIRLSTGQVIRRRFDDAPAYGHLVLHQQVLLVEILHELAEDLAGHGHVVVQPRLHGEVLLDEILVLQPLPEAQRLLRRSSPPV